MMQKKWTFCINVNCLLMGVHLGCLTLRYMEKMYDVPFNSFEQCNIKLVLN